MGLLCDGLLKGKNFGNRACQCHDSRDNAWPARISSCRLKRAGLNSLN